MTEENVQLPPPEPDGYIEIVLKDGPSIRYNFSGMGRRGWYWSDAFEGDSRSLLVITRMQGRIEIPRENVGAVFVKGNSPSYVEARKMWEEVNGTPRDSDVRG